MSDVSTPESFGAVGDGHADDTDALQRALDGPASTVELRPGATYRISRRGELACLEVCRSGLTLLGRGARLLLTEHRFDGRAFMGLLVRGESVRDRRSDFRCEGLTLLGQGPRQGPVPAEARSVYNLLQVTWVDRVTLRDVTAEDGVHNGIAVAACRTLRMERCHARRTGKNGIYVADLVDDFVVRECTADDANATFGHGRYFSGNDYAGLALAGRNGRVERCTLTGSGIGVLVGFTGQPVSDATDLVLADTVGEGNRTSGIAIVSSVQHPPLERRIEVLGCTARGNGEDGLRATGAARIAVRGGHYVDNERYGILLDHAHDVDLEDLHVTGNRSGIWMSDVDAVRLKRSRLTQNRLDGLELAGPARGLDASGNDYRLNGRTRVNNSSGRAPAHSRIDG